MITDWIVALFLVVGSLFMLVAAIGVVRFPDLYTRMHAATKASSFGILLMLIGVSIQLPGFYLIMEAIMVIVFIFMTAPVASHMIGRVAHLFGTPLWEKTTIDELRTSLPHNEPQGEKTPETE